MGTRTYKTFKWSKKFVNLEIFINLSANDQKNNSKYIKII